MKNKYYYRLSDLIPEWSDKGPFYPQQTTVPKKFTDMLNNIWPDSDSEFTGTINETQILGEFFRKHFYPAMHSAEVAVISKEVPSWVESVRPSEDDEEFKEMQRDVAMRIFNKIADTQSVYEKNIELYSMHEDNLLNALRTTTLFNDTPQSGGNFEDDYHVTTATQSTADGPIIQRLDEIHKLLRNEYAGWLEEFERMLIMGD